MIANLLKFCPEVLAGLMRLTVIAIATLVAGCGTTQEAVLTMPGPTTTDGIGVGDTAGTDGVSQAFALDDGDIVPPAGVSPFPVTSFVSYVGFAHGSTKSDVSNLMPEQDPKLGKRTNIEIMGSHGYRYAGHLAVSWQTESGLIDYVSIKSDAAIGFLNEHSRQDDKLKALWNVAPGQAIALLGNPTDRVDRPHAHTLRYEFEGQGGREGTLSLEFTKLTSPPKCAAVSVHWTYK